MALRRSTSRRDTILVIVCLLPIAVSSPGCEQPGARSGNPSHAAVGAEASAPGGFITIRGQRVALELAITPDEQRLGLGRRDSLAWDHGMLFLYEEAAFYRFWMKDMRFDIDIVWIRGDRIVDISHGVRHVPGETGQTVAPLELADKVLEVPAGYAIAHAWRPGQRIALELSRPWP